MLDSLRKRREHDFSGDPVAVGATKCCRGSTTNLLADSLSRQSDNRCPPAATQRGEHYDHSCSSAFVRRLWNALLPSGHGHTCFHSPRIAKGRHSSVTAVGNIDLARIFRSSFYRTAHRPGPTGKRGLGACFHFFH